MRATQFDVRWFRIRQSVAANSKERPIVSMSLSTEKYRLHYPEASYRTGFGDSRLKLAVHDIAAGVAAYRVWGYLGWHDIKQRYRGSTLGPFWLTISTAIMVGMLSFLYGNLFGLSLSVYAPFLALGTIVWVLISTLLNESSTVFVLSEPVIKQIRQPLTLHVCRMVWRNVIIFFHNSVILVPVLYLFGTRPNFDIVWLPVGLLLIALNGIWVGIALGALCARFRDIPPIVGSLVQVVFFVTPIMWLPDILRARGITWLITINPVYHFIEIIRAPFLGNAITIESWLWVLGTTFFGFTLALMLLVRSRSRIAYWL